MKGFQCLDVIFPPELCKCGGATGNSGLWSLLHSIPLDRAGGHVGSQLHMLGTQELCHQRCQHHLCDPAGLPHYVLPEAESAH